MWFKTRTPVPNDPILHQCILTYASDLGTGFGDLHMRIMPTSGGPSLDHNLWFHHPVRVDDWFYLDQTPMSIAGGRGLYRGSIHDIKGKTCASMNQEMVIREQPHPDPNIPTTI
jgi:acyl-CoA thioesterase-2